MPYTCYYYVFLVPPTPIIMNRTYPFHPDPGRRTLKNMGHLQKSFSENGVSTMST